MTADTRFARFLGRYPVMQRARLRKSLERLQRFSGHMLQRRDWAEMNAPHVRVDRTAHRVWTDMARGHFYDFKDLPAVLIDYLEWLQDEMATRDFAIAC